MIDEMEKVLGILLKEKQPQDYIRIIEEENERLKEENEKIEKEYKNKVDEIGNLTSKIYKIVEFINKHFVDSEGIICKYTGEHTCETNYNFLEELLNILQGSEDNE